MRYTSRKCSSVPFRTRIPLQAEFTQPHGRPGPHVDPLAQAQLRPPQIKIAANGAILPAAGALPGILGEGGGFGGHLVRQGQQRLDVASDRGVSSGTSAPETLKGSISSIDSWSRPVSLALAHDSRSHSAARSRSKTSNAYCSEERPRAVALGWVTNKRSTQGGAGRPERPPQAESLPQCARHGQHLVG